MTLLCEKMGSTFLVIRYRLRSIASVAIDKSGRVSLNILRDQSLFVCWQHASRRSIMPFSSSFFNHRRPTCHFVENFLVLDSDFPYSFDWSQVAFGAFSFFFFSTTLETPEIYFHIILLIFVSDQFTGEHAVIRKLGKYGKQFASVQRRQGCGRPRIISSIKCSI